MEGVTLSILLSTLSPDQRIKLGAEHGVAWFYVGTVGDLTKKMTQYNKRIKSVDLRREWDYKPLYNRPVISCETCDEWVEPEGCLRVIVTGKELGDFWVTGEVKDNFPQMKFRVREVIDNA